MATAVPGEALHIYPLSNRFRPLPHVIWTRHADATVILDAERGQYYTLNEVAGRVWELLGGGEPLVEILRLLRDDYDAPPERLKEDLESLLGRLLRAALIESVSA